jgi:hypothetical protein
MTNSQEGEEEHEGSRPETDSPARPPRVAKLPERLGQQPIAALEHDRCGRDCDRRQRIALRLEMRREEGWSVPHALPSGNHLQHATSRQRRDRRPRSTRAIANSQAQLHGLGEFGDAHRLVSNRLHEARIAAWLWPPPPSPSSRSRRRSSSSLFWPGTSCPEAVDGSAHLARSYLTS